MKLLAQMGRLIPHHQRFAQHDSVMVFLEERLDDPKEIIRSYAADAADQWR
jgi:hypothetical protein